MYKVELSSTNNSISDFNNTQLICSYIYVKKTYNHLYKKKMKNLSRKEKKAIIHDLSLFEAIKQKKYFLRCLTPQKWLKIGMFLMELRPKLESGIYQLKVWISIKCSSHLKIKIQIR